MITSNPMIIFKSFKSISSTDERIIEGAKIVIPAANPLCTRNKTAPNVLVF